MKKKDLQEHKQSNSVKIVSGEKSLEKLKTMTHAEVKDSMLSNFSTLIKPIGHFSYSEKNGFSGDAEYLMLTGQTAIGHKLTINSTSQVEKKVKKNQKL